MEKYTMFIIWKNWLLKWLSYYQRQSKDSMQSVLKHQQHFSQSKKKNNPKIFMETKKASMVKAISRKKNRAGDITFPYIRLSRKATVIQTVWYWHKSWQINAVEYNRESRNKLIHLWSVGLWQRQDYIMGERQSLQSVVLWILDRHM